MNIKMSHIDMRDAVFEEIFKLAKDDENVVFLTSDMGAFTLEKFRKEMPDQFFNLGISEQNMINVAAGMALTGKTVFVHSLIPFAVMRCFEQIKASVSAMNLNVNIVGGGPGYAYETDGPSHHGLEDIACMRSLGNIMIYNPSDSYSASGCVRKMYDAVGPSYLRMDRGIWPQLFDEESLEKDYLFCEGGLDNLVVSSGTIANNAYSFFLYNSDRVSYLNVLRLDHLDEILDVDLLRYNLITVKEENAEAGGLCEIISKIYLKQRGNADFSAASAVSSKNGCPYGSRKYLLEQNNLLFSV